MAGHGERAAAAGTGTTLVAQARVLRARAWWVVLGVALGLAVGGLVALKTAPTYSADISLYVATQSDGDNDQAYEGQQLSQERVISYVELVTRPLVTKAVIQDLHLDTTPDALAGEITASSEQDSVLLDVTVVTHDPGQSVAIANSIGRVFPGAVAGLERPVRADATPPVVVRVVEPADSATMTSPSWPVPVAFGLLAGLVLGVFLAWIRQATDTSIRSASTVREVTGLPLLATTYTDRAAGAGFVPARDAPNSPTAEAVRRLRTNLAYLDVDDPPRVLGVASAVPGEGKTTLACDLAVALAAGEGRVLLLEADLRRPAVVEHFGLPRTVGLTTVLAGQVDLADAIQTTAGGLDVLASGALVPNPSELLASARMQRLVGELRARYDHVVVDTAPLLTVSDASAVTPLTDGVLLLCRWGRTSRAKLAQATEILASASARALGTVLTMAPARSAPEGRAGYGNLPASAPEPPPSTTPRARPAPPSTTTGPTVTAEAGVGRHRGLPVRVVRTDGSPLS